MGAENPRPATASQPPAAEPAAKFMILDGHSLIHRAYFAIRPLSTSGGEVTHAVYGFTMMLLRLLEDEKPDYVAVAFDRAAPTFRHQMYAEYKAQRPEMAEDLRTQIPRVKEMVRAFRIRSFELDGYEADDLIGTLARQAGERGMQVAIVTGDRDLLQLADAHVTVLLTRKGITELEAYDPARVEERFGVPPEHLPDWRGLVGDPSDNIPGVPGVGGKTAAKLLGQFGTLENLLAHLDQVSGRTAEILRTHREQAELSKKLSIIETHVPLQVDWDELRRRPGDRDELLRLCGELEFRQIAERIQQMEAGGATAEQPAGEPVAAGGRFPWDSWQVVPVIPGDTEDAALARLREARQVAVAPVWEGPSALRGRLLGLMVVPRPEATTAYFWPFGAGQAPVILALLARRDRPSLVGYDLKQLLLLLHAGGGLREHEAGRIQGLGREEDAGEDFDTLVAGYVAAGGRGKLDLASLCLDYLGWGMEPSGALPAEVLAGVEAGLRPAAFEALAQFPLSDALAAELEKSGQEQLFRRIEMPLVPLLAKMEWRGIRIDPQRLEELAKEMGGRLQTLEREIFQLAGEEFNINSPKQLAVVLFEKLGLKPRKRKKSGYSTDAEVLEELSEEHPIAEKLLEYRLLGKLKSTYIDVLPSLADPATQRVHTTFNQTVTATGRLSSTNPNLQNIPIRTEIGGRIREAFVPSPGMVLISADYSQIELRVLAHMAQDPVLIEAFRSGQDIHTRTASEVFGVSPDQVTPQMRSAAKAINFGIVYGISSFGLARNTGISREEARRYIQGYFARYPGVQAYQRRMVEEAREKGYVATLFHRRRYLPDIHSRNYALRSYAERMAMNTPIQGTAADIIKIAMIRAERELAGQSRRARMLLQVHDELIFEAPVAEAQETAEIIRRCMSQAADLAVPLDVGVQIASNWLGAD
ncbi:MAG: DNA polymerase I [Firmicutes bacterium]|nr:DNA polymerase I [Bacillota bacterium]